MKESKKLIEAAPIIIPTCNRIGHLTDLIDSIRNNDGAKDTELYISVDYPPSEKYKDGYSEVVDYCKRLQHDNGFKNVNVYIQNRNLGPIRNGNFLLERVRERYHAYIFTEDDNILARNTLLFLNTCLEKFKESEDIYCVCANNPNGKVNIKEKAVTYRYFSPYVTGYWVDKSELFEKWLTATSITENAKRIFSMFRFKVTNSGSFNLLINGFILDKNNRTFTFENGEPTPIDIYHNAYMFFNKKKAIFPRANLVFNNGMDGSGVNSKATDEELPIISGEDIDYSDINTVYTDDSSTKYQKPKDLYSWLRDKKPVFLYLLWRMGIIKP